MWSCNNAECVLLEFWPLLFTVFIMFDAGLYLLDRCAVPTNCEKPSTGFSNCGGHVNHIITYYFPLQGTPKLYGRNNTYCGRDRRLKQSAGNGSGSALLEDQWEQSWWEIGTLMVPAALSCHSLACLAVLAKAEVKRLNHWGKSGGPGHLIYFFDQRSALGERHCVPSLFIKIGLNGLSLCLCAHWEKQRRGDIKGHSRPRTNVDPLLIYLHNKFKEESGIGLIWF